jgi:hypothetical protein
LKKLLYEPLIHFLLLGALIFLVFNLRNSESEDENSIVITKKRVEQLITEWEDKNLSVATKKVKQEIIDKEIYRNVLYKEAIKVGLDRSDNTIKGHLAKKMEAVVFDTDEFAPPSSDELKSFMQKNIEKYLNEQNITFQQKMIDSETSHFEKEYTVTKFQASNIFGRAFAQALFDLKEDGKVHKLESDYGVHEVKIIKKPQPQPKAFDEIKEKLKDDYLRWRQGEKNREVYEELKSQYEISIKEK